MRVYPKESISALRKQMAEAGFRFDDEPGVMTTQGDVARPEHGGVYLKAPGEAGRCGLPGARHREPAQVAEEGCPAAQASAGETWEGAIGEVTESVEPRSRAIATEVEPGTTDHLRRLRHYSFADSMIVSEIREVLQSSSETQDAETRVSALEGLKLETQQAYLRAGTRVTTKEPAMPQAADTPVIDETAAPETAASEAPAGDASAPAEVKPAKGKKGSKSKTTKNPDVEAKEGKGKKAAPEFVPGIAAGGTVSYLPLDKIDLDDEKFMFRARLRVGDLQASIADEGQQLPIVVRKVGKTRAMRYQIISGFRRVTAIKALGWKQVAAIVREDLDDDESAFRAAVLENTARKTYSDIDRAIAIERYERDGHTSTSVAAMMGITPQMKNKIKSLRELPQVVQDAIDDPTHPLKTKHGITLRTLARKYKDQGFEADHYAKWVTRVDDDELSVSALIRLVNKEYGGKQVGARFNSIFQERGTDWNNGEVRLAPVKLTISAMTDAEKAKLKGELKKVMDAL